MNIVLLKAAHGYTTDTDGFSGVFSWGRCQNRNRAIYMVIGHIEGFTDLISYGVTDDHGNIVKVQS